MTAMLRLHSRQIGDVSTAVSGGWDTCMSKTYCKWPVIAGIIIGVIGIISILWCCLRCCGCIKSCCPCCGGRSKKNKHTEQAAPASLGGYQPAPQQPVYEHNNFAQQTPQYAQFDSYRKPAGQKVNEDALPAMPSWETAQSRKVLDDKQREEDVEMGHVNNQSTGQKTPTLPYVQPNPRSPVISGASTPAHRYIQPDQRSLVSGVSAPSTPGPGYAHLDNRAPVSGSVSGQRSPVGGYGHVARHSPVTESYEAGTGQGYVGYVHPTHHAQPDPPAIYAELPAAEPSSTQYVSPSAYGGATGGPPAARYPDGPAEMGGTEMPAAPAPSAAPYAAYSPQGQSQQTGVTGPSHSPPITPGGRTIPTAGQRL